MKRIGIITNLDKDIDAQYAKLTANHIIAKGGQVFIPQSQNGQIFEHCSIINQEEVYEDLDAIICIGGDGTFLKVARKSYQKDIPILGINLGHLGFLTEIDKDEIESAIQNLFLGDFTIEKRMLLEGTVYENDKVIHKNIALNDVVVSRVALSRILHLKMYLNGAFADSFPGDGIIIASPTGSTAYSLSAGGPIVEPDTEIMVITPICPHTLYSRSVITKGQTTVKLEIDSGYVNDAMLTFDGQIGFEISNNHSIEIKMADKYVKIIRLHKKGFFSILRSKIYKEYL